MKTTILKILGEDPRLAEYMGPEHWAVFLLMISAGATLMTTLAWGTAMVILNSSTG